MKIVSYTAEALPPLTNAERKHLADLATLSDDTIDTSDIPELSDEAWRAGVRGRFYRPVKQQITARVDAIPRREMLASGRQVRRP